MNEKNRNNKTRSNSATFPLFCFPFPLSRPRNDSQAASPAPNDPPRSKSKQSTLSKGTGNSFYDPQVNGTPTPAIYLRPLTYRKAPDAVAPHRNR